MRRLHENDLRGIERALANDPAMTTLLHELVSRLTYEPGEAGLVASMYGAYCGELSWAQCEPIALALDRIAAADPYATYNDMTIQWLALMWRRFTEPQRAGSD